MRQIDDDDRRCVNVGECCQVSTTTRVPLPTIHDLLLATDLFCPSFVALKRREQTTAFSSGVEVPNIDP